MATKGCRSDSVEVPPFPRFGSTGSRREARTPSLQLQLVWLGELEGGQAAHMAVPPPCLPLKDPRSEAFLYRLVHSACARVRSLAANAFANCMSVGLFCGSSASLFLRACLLALRASCVFATTLQPAPGKAWHATSLSLYLPSCWCQIANIDAFIRVARSATKKIESKVVPNPTGRATSSSNSPAANESSFLS